MAVATRPESSGSRTEKSDFTIVSVEDSRQPASKPRAGGIDDLSRARMGRFTTCLALDRIGYRNLSDPHFAWGLRGLSSEATRGSAGISPQDFGIRSGTPR
jgi:hypothetical protein